MARGDSDEEKEEEGERTKVCLLESKSARSSLIAGH